MAQVIQLLTIIILIITSLIIFLVIWAAMILLHGKATSSMFASLFCTSFVILIAWGFLRPIDPVCFQSKLKDSSEMFTTDIKKDTPMKKFAKRVSNFFKNHMSPHFKKEKYTTAVDSVYSTYVPGSTQDDVFLTEQPSAVDEDDFSYQIIASDEKLETTAEENVQKQLEAQPTIINSQRFKEQVYQDMLDKYLETVNLTPEEALGKSEDEQKTAKIQKLGLSMRDLHAMVIMNELNYTYEDMYVLYNERYIKFLRNDYENRGQFSIQVDFLTLTQDQNDQLSYIGADSDSPYIEITEDRIKYLEELRNVSEENAHTYREQMKSEVIRERLKDLIDARAAVEFDKQRQNLVESEVDNLKDIRLRAAITYNSQALLDKEYGNPYTILPKDMWFRPEKGAKDILAGKSCNCPMEVSSDKMNLFPVN